MHAHTSQLTEYAAQPLLLCLDVLISFVLHFLHHFHIVLGTEHGRKRGRGREGRTRMHTAECSRSVHKYYFLGKSKIEAQLFSQDTVVVAILQWSVFPENLSTEVWDYILGECVYRPTHTSPVGYCQETGTII